MNEYCELLLFLNAKHKIGDSMTFTSYGNTFEIKCLRQGSWHLRDINIKSRSRFGTFPEIREDVGKVLESGALPGGDKGR
jgi:hypothetical protein